MAGKLHTCATNLLHIDHPSGDNYHFVALTSPTLGSLILWSIPLLERASEEIGEIFEVLIHRRQSPTNKT